SMGACCSRTNADDRLPADPLGRIESGDGVVEGRDVGLGGVAALFVDLAADCLLLGLLGLGPFGGMVPSGKELTRSRMAVLNPFNSLSRSSALIFDEAQTITANAALARSRGGNRSSAKAPTILCIVAFTVESMPDSLSVAAGPHHNIGRAFDPALYDNLSTGSGQNKRQPRKRPVP